MTKSDSTFPVATKGDPLIVSAREDWAARRGKKLTKSFEMLKGPKGAG